MPAISSSISVVITSQSPLASNILTSINSIKRSHSVDLGSDVFPQNVKTFLIRIFEPSSKSLDFNTELWSYEKLFSIGVLIGFWN